MPLWQSTSQDSKLAAAKKRLTAAEKSLLGLRQTLPHSIDRVLAEIAGARENYTLFGDALSVQAAQLADASLAAYSVGKVEFNTMLSARIRLMRIQLKTESYKYQIYKKQAELEEIDWHQAVIAGGLAMRPLNPDTGCTYGSSFPRLCHATVAGLKAGDVDPKTGKSH